MYPPKLAELLRRIPKAELHIHLEGALRWSSVRELHPDGARFPVTPPWAGQVFETFMDFAKYFRSHLIGATGTAERVERHTFEMLEDLAKQNVVYAEPITGLNFHTVQGLSVCAVLDAMRRGIERAEKQYGIRTKLIVGLNAHMHTGEIVAMARECIELAGPRAGGLVAGIDLMGDDRIALAPEYVALYADAKKLGLRLRVHAGELGGPEIVRERLAQLGAEHLSHGIHAIRDPVLTKELAARGVWFHVAPSSNVRLKIVPNYDAHPLRGLLAARCKVTVNSDDPLFFEATLTDEFINAADKMGCTLPELRTLAENGLRASLLPEAERAAGLAKINKLFEEYECNGGAE